MGNVFRVLKVFFKKMPLDATRKTQLKNGFYKTFGGLFKNNESYRQWLAHQRWMETLLKEKKQGVMELDWEKVKSFSFQGTIAIQLHLFYVDLMEEFVGYFKHMPYDFDLYIAMIDDSEKETVMQQALTVPHCKKVIVKKVENRGRDVAPMVTAFARDLLKYDYFCHIHSKKSLFTGNEQMDWRKHLMNHLFGSEQLIRGIFYGFEHGEKVGMIYPETYSAMPYWGHTWLQNSAAREELLQKIKVPYIANEKYIDFPMGTMFWARTKALKQFFESGLVVEDFPEEDGQTDGTIAHAFERCTVPVCKHNGYDILVYDERTKQFIYNKGRKNFEQYYAKSFGQMKEFASKCDIVSFDIFDTLVTRKVARPDDAFDLLEMHLKSKMGLEIPYRQWRKEAESICRKKNPQSDCDLDEIYREFASVSGFNAETCERIKEAEIENELDLIEPKPAMIEFYDYVVKDLKKRVFLVSDMYMRRADIERILQKCGIGEYEQLYLSCELNLRKDDKTFWKEYSKRYDGLKWMHIGDNETSDMQISGDYGILGYHILSSADLYECSNIGEVYNLCQIDNPVTSVAAGLSLKRLFNQPFGLNEDMLRLVVGREEDLGYALLGPVILGYIHGLCREVLDKKVNKVLFFAREGYLLKDLFNIAKKYVPSLASVQGEYLLVSRRALSLASVECEEDIQELLKLSFTGSFQRFLHHRFGIDDVNASLEEIQLPQEVGKVIGMLKSYEEEILKKAKWERDNYLKYYHSLGEISDSRIMVSDIGYSGTIQYYLSKLTGQSYDGYYFATDSKKRPLAIAGNTMKGYYVEDDSCSECSVSNVYKYHLLLECILIAPKGQLVCVDANGEFVYTEEKNPYFTQQVERIQEGIRQYVKDFYETCGASALELPLDKTFSEKMMKAAVEYGVIDKSLEACFTVEDFYVSDQEISVLGQYKNKKETK